MTEIQQKTERNISISKRIQNDDIRITTGCDSIIIQRENLADVIKELMILYCNK